MPTARDRFVDVSRRDILGLDAAEIDCGIDRVLEHRRAQVDRFIGYDMPARIAEPACAPPTP